MFQEPQKEQPSASGVAAIEAEGEFVEIGIQILCGDRALMGAEQPALEQGGHAMHRRHGNVGRIPAGREVDGVVPVPLFRQTVVALPAVRAHLRAGFDCGRDKGNQTGAGDIVDPAPGVYGRSPWATIPRRQ